MTLYETLQKIEEWVKKNFDVSDFGVDEDEGEIVVWLKDVYFDYRDLQKLREKIIITEWHVEADECKVILEVRGYSRE
jgi:hypothetical protein